MLNLKRFRSSLVVASLYYSSTLLGQTRTPTEEAPVMICKPASLKVIPSPDCASQRSTVEPGEPVPGEAAHDVPPQVPATQPSTPKWQYGGFVDFGYSFDFNPPANQ